MVVFDAAFDGGQGIRFGFRPAALRLTKKIRGKPNLPKLAWGISDFRAAEPTDSPGACRSESRRDLALNLVHCEHHEQYNSEDKNERQ